MRFSTPAVLLFLCATTAQAQNIGINLTGLAPAASAMLDVENANKGMLVPRVALTATDAVGPITGAMANSLLVYNTATAGAAPTNVTPGFYYYETATTSWQPILNGVKGWSTAGNNGVTTSNFLGSINAADLIFKTTNLERMRIIAGGKVGIGVSPTLAQLEVNSGAGDAIYGYSANVGGYLGRETNFTIGVGSPQVLFGAGVYASNPAASYTSVFAQSTGTATVAAQVNYSTVWMASYNLVENSTAGFNPPGLYSQLNINNIGLGGNQMAMRGFLNRGTINGNPGFAIGVDGTSVSQKEDAIGVQGYAASNAPLNVGGYFDASNYTGSTFYGYAYVGGTTNGGLTTNKITGTGTVSEIIPTADHGRITLTCPESPEYWYQDYGSVLMINGHAHVALDPILSDIIFVNEENPLRVFCTPVDLLEFNGVAVVNRSSTGFDLVELNSGSHSGTLDYQLVAKPRTNYGQGRFSQAPGPAWLKSDQEPISAKAANQLKDRKIFRWPADWEVYGYDLDKVTPIGGTVRGGPHAGMFKVAEGVFMDHMPLERPK
ncbi:MAG: hypothetical protein IPN44_00010 [Flavobacteriales bacterium]|nr:hypothetical protein [Flavobacteriales bacterium]